MSFGIRKCESCSRSKRSDGDDLEICYSHQLGKWLCLSCYLRGTNK